MLRTAVAAALTALTLTTPLTAEAGQKTREYLRIVGFSGAATWDYVQGNIGTFVSVVVTENDQTGTAGPSEDAFVSIAINQFDVDTGNVLLTGVALVQGAQNFNFTIDRNLSTARLVIDDAIFQDDSTFSFFNLDVDLTWTATAPAVDQKDKDTEQFPGIKVKTTFHGVLRDAEATGSIFGKNIQFTPVPSTSAQLQFNRFGSKTITTQTP